MKSFIHIVLLLFLFLGKCPDILYSADPSFEFLRMEVSAKAAGMAGAYVSIEKDVHALFYNPAGIATINNPTGALSYMDGVLDFKIGSAAFVYPIGNKGIGGLSINYINYGDFEGKDRFGNDTGTFNARDYFVALSYATSLSNRIFTGVTGRYISSKIAGYGAAALTVDAGILYVIPKHDLNIGFTISNIGQAISAYIETKEKVPTHIKAGLSKKLAYLPAVLSLEIRQFFHNEFQVAGGGEIKFNERFFGRLGYNSIGRDQKIGISGYRFSGFSFGLGFLFRQIEIDYSFSSLGTIGNQNRITIVSSL